MASLPLLPGHRKGGRYGSTCTARDAPEMRDEMMRIAAQEKARHEFEVSQREPAIGAAEADYDPHAPPGTSLVGPLDLGGR